MTPRQMSELFWKWIICAYSLNTGHIRTLYLHTIPLEVPPPKNEADFERMCGNVYGVVFNDRTPKINGRRGQVQGGVDIFVSAPGIGRIGIQCKKYTLSTITWANVEEEVEKADRHATPIKKLIMATTAPNDAVLLKKVQALSDERAGKGLFEVEIEFWDDICQRIETYPVLQDSYAPHVPGAAYHRQEQTLGAIQGIAQRTHDAVVSIGGLSTARDDSADRLITSQLDRTNELLQTGRYRDAIEHLDAIGKDLEPFDRHQKARWYLQRGLALWLGRTDEQEAATLFLRAHDLYPDEDRMAAAHIRGLLLQGRNEEAYLAGTSAMQRFPNSQQVWYAWANVQGVRGERLTLADVPSNLKTDSDALLFIAQAELVAGNLNEAIRVSQEGASSADAGFFAKATAVRIAADCGVRCPVASAFGLLPGRERQALEFAADLFKPWQENLWQFQSDAVKEVATNLGIVHVLLRRFDEALLLARDAEIRGRSTSELLRIQVSCLDELDRDNELLTLADARLPEMNQAALAIVGHAAAKRGRTDILERAYVQACALEPAPNDISDLLFALRWEVMAQSDQQEAAIAEIMAANVASKDSLVTCCIAARILKRFDKADEAMAIVDRAQLLVTNSSRDSDKLMLAELLYTTNRWGAAAALFEELASPGSGQVTHLHNRLLACYVRSHNRKRAKSLIESFPKEWMNNDEARHLAIDLGQLVADFKFLRPLADAQVAKNPQSVGAWLLKLRVSLHALTPPEFQNDLRSVPEILHGTAMAITQLAAMEIRHGEMHKGMRRLYRMLRSNLDDPEALSRYFLCLVASREDLPWMDLTRQIVSDGTALHLRDAYGRTANIVIDPADMRDLPPREGFTQADSELSKALIGIEVGQTVSLPMRAFGEKTTHTVLSATSAYRRLLQIVQERAHGLGGLPDLKSIPVRKTDGGKIDLTHIEAEIKRSSSISREIFDLYAQGSLTIAWFSQLQGRSSIDSILSWPSDGPPLFTAAGTHDDLGKALTLLCRPDTSYVIDGLALVELVNLGVINLLSNLPKVYISARTKAELDAKLREAEADRSVATAGEIDGKLAFIEQGVNHHRRRVELFQAALAAVSTYCEVIPGYGELDSENVNEKLLDILRDEELDLLLLAKAKDACLLTIDGRLRGLLANFAKIEGIWPQALLLHYLQQGLVSQERISSASIKQFLNNRSFIFLGSEDLLWMCFQGGEYLQMGLQRFKTHIASKNFDFFSTSSMALNFLRDLAYAGTPMNAFAEVFEHVMEGLLRHPEQSEDFLRAVAELIDALAGGWSEEGSLYEPVVVTSLQRRELVRKYLIEQFQRARSYAEEPATLRPIHVQTVFCTHKPQLWLTKKPSPETANMILAHASEIYEEDRPDDEKAPVSETSSGRESAYLIAPLSSE